MANESYWVTVAQVSPVLALALILEARALAKRTRRKRRFRVTRVERITGALLLVVSAVSTTTCFILALIILNGGLRELAFFPIATILLAISFAVVAINPLLPFVIALASDVAPLVRDVMPWSQRKLLIRHIRELQQVIQTTGTEFAQVCHVRNMEYATAISTHTAFTGRRFSTRISWPPGRDI